MWYCKSNWSMGPKIVVLEKEPYKKWIIVMVNIATDGYSKGENMMGYRFFVTVVEMEM